MVKYGVTKPEKDTSFYPRKIGKAGGTRTLAVGKILPPDWLVVKVSVLTQTDKAYILKIEKLI